VSLCCAHIFVYYSEISLFNLVASPSLRGGCHRNRLLGLLELGQQLPAGYFDPVVVITRTCPQTRPPSVVLVRDHLSTAWNSEVRALYNQRVRVPRPPAARSPSISLRRFALATERCARPPQPLFFCSNSATKINSLIIRRARRCNPRVFSCFVRRNRK